MKNLIITALTIFAFITGPIMAGERSFDMDNAFAYSKSTQSLGSEGSAGNSAGGLSSGAATGILVFIGLVILVALIASNSGDDHNYSGGSS